MAEKKYYYYDVQINNNSSNDDIKLSWKDQQSGSLIKYNERNTYAIMINEIKLDTDGIPLFIFNDNRYKVKITNTVSSLTNEQYVVFNSALDSVYPDKVDYRRRGIYYIYQFLIMLNRAIVLALQGAGYAGTEIFAQFDPDTKMFYLNRDTTATSIDIQMNSYLIYLFNGFYSRKTNNDFWSIIMNDSINLSASAGGRNIYRSEYSSTDNWRQITSINIYLGNNLNILNSFSLKYSYDQLNYSKNDEKSQQLLKIFYPDPTYNYYDSRSILFFKNQNYPTCLKNISSESLSNNSFTNMAFNIVFETDDGLEYPVYLDKANSFLGEIVIEETIY